MEKIGTLLNYPMQHLIENFDILLHNCMSHSHSQFLLICFVQIVSNSYDSVTQSTFPKEFTFSSTIFFLCNYCICLFTQHIRLLTPLNNIPFFLKELGDNSFIVLN